MKMKGFRQYIEGKEAVAAVEAALLFPVLLLMLLGMLDLGYGILASQKTIRASQVVADLVARKSTLNMSEINEAVEAGRLALDPFDTSSYGVDIVSIFFDENGQSNVCWRHTVNMSPNQNVLASTNGLGASGEGVLAVTVKYRYAPDFSSHIISDINMQEVAFTRGRRSSVIQMNGSCS